MFKGSIKDSLRLSPASAAWEELLASIDTCILDRIIFQSLADGSCGFHMSPAYGSAVSPPVMHQGVLRDSVQLLLQLLVAVKHLPQAKEHVVGIPNAHIHRKNGN